MEQVNMKLFALVLEATGSSFSPKIYSKLRSVISRCAASYHNKTFEFDSDDERNGIDRSKKSGWNFNKNNYEYDENEDVGGRPRYISNKPRSNDYDRGRPRFQRDDYNERDNFQRRDKFQNAGGRLSRPRWDNIELKTFEKNFYTPSETVLNRSAEDIIEFRNTHKLTLLGKNIPNPILEFSDHKFPPEIMDTFSKKGFERPTPIQAQGWPIALSGTDFIGIGQTGSGKTLGYTVPGVIHIKHQAEVNEGDGPVGLVLAPTRELVQQIYEVSVGMFNASGLGAACLYGGASKNVQARTLYRRPSFCIATPGRLLDFLEMGVTNLQRCTYLVVDEADRMLDMGFEPQIRKIIDQIRPDRQTLMWSATWPKEVQELATDFLNDFIRLNVGSDQLYANPDIKQELEVCDPYDKRNRFMERMQEVARSHEKILVFAQTKVQVDNLARSLHQAGIKARGIHGDYSQMQRDRTLDGFRRGQFPVLVATDVASRGLDVDDITLVVNFDFPDDIEDYVHRIGRTARAGKSGNALSLITERDNAAALKKLVKLLEKSNIDVPSELVELADMGMHSKRSKRKPFRGGYNRFHRGDGNTFGEM